MSKQLKVNQIADASSLNADATYGFTAEWHKVVSIHAIWTATTATVSLKIQYSNDNSNWYDFTTATAISNASGNVMWDVAASGKDALYWRVFPDFGSGTLTTFKAYVAYTAR
ncbi:MAG TPA: hypothetical protein V6C65_26130 [Allocoleopsis sp.]